MCLASWCLSSSFFLEPMLIQSGVYPALTSTETALVKSVMAPALLNPGSFSRPRPLDLSPRFGTDNCLCLLKIFSPRLCRITTCLWFSFYPLTFLDCSSSFPRPVIVVLQSSVPEPLYSPSHFPSSLLSLPWDYIYP